MVERTLGDISAELEGLEGLIDIVSMVTEPRRNVIGGSIPSEQSLDAAFFSIVETIRHIKDEVDEWEGRYIALERKCNKAG